MNDDSCQGRGGHGSIAAARPGAGLTDRRARSGCRVCHQARGAYLATKAVYSRILVPVDLSDGNAGALKVAARLARTGKAEITLLHVVEEIEGIDDANIQRFYAELTTKAQDTLARWAQALVADGLRAEVVVVRGKRAREIVRHAQDAGSDLIVLATHRVGPQRPEGALGTLSHQVALLAGCSVLLVRT